MQLSICATSLHGAVTVSVTRFVTPSQATTVTFFTRSLPSHWRCVPTSSVPLASRIQLLLSTIGLSRVILHVGFCVTMYAPGYLMNGGDEGFHKSRRRVSTSARTDFASFLSVNCPTTCS